VRAGFVLIFEHRTPKYAVLSRVTRKRLVSEEEPTHMGGLGAVKPSVCSYMFTISFQYTTYSLPRHSELRDGKTSLVRALITRHKKLRIYVRFHTCTNHTSCLLFGYIKSAQSHPGAASPILYNTSYRQ
jgi:hypothetical protein